MSKRGAAKVAKRAAIFGGVLYLIDTIARLEKKRREAVFQANTISEMFGSFVNFAGVDTYEEWEKTYPFGRPDLFEYEEPLVFDSPSFDYAEEDDADEG